MEKIVLDEKWVFRRGLLDSIGILESDPGVEVNLPHDGMIGTKVTHNAPAGVDSGYFTGDLVNYTKFVFIPKEWEGECVALYFDGVMLNATVEINGYKAGLQHYGYAPFYVDLTNLVSFGEENRITIHANASMQPNSRWYSGSGMFRGAFLCHGPKVHIASDGIFAYTREVSDGTAFIEAKVDVVNATTENKLSEVTINIYEEGVGENSVSFAAAKETAVPVYSTKRVIQLEPLSTSTANMALNLDNPKLWDIDNPFIYRVEAVVKTLGSYRTHFIENDIKDVDTQSAIFGVRTITADAKRGLRINGKTVKLKGGCLHHDNGLLGAVSMYEIEARKVKKLKEVGFNAVRTAHNPPSAALIEACDRLGMFVFDEAFDAWGIAKRGGDYNQYFETDWEKDLTAFIRRDRIHPSVIIWSTGNEIPERGGLNNGYSLATKLANKVKSLDPSRPVSNGICSFWSGLDDYLAKGQNQSQNSNDGLYNTLWETATEPFTNGLDIVGYNYMEDIYERDHEMFPERVILGSENFPKEIGFRWPMVEKLDYVIGDFTWTAWDYIGEAGIGKTVYYDLEDPKAPKFPWDLMPQATSPYPWRLANDADFDITGKRLPQGDYRSVVWGSSNTYLYAVHPKHYGKSEMVSMWGFTDVLKSWNFEGFEGKPVELVVFSNADEVEIVVNGKSIGRKPVSMERPLPNSVRFDALYERGTVEAVSYKDGVVVGNDILVSSKAPVKVVLIPEKKEIKADGHDVMFVNVEIQDEEGNLVSDAEINLEASYEGEGCLAGFGTANPITEENYTDEKTTSYKGLAAAIVRSGYNAGNGILKVCGEGIEPAILEITIC